jgi:hypothetical protein
LIHQRHLTPSCRGRAPTAERTLNPARMLRESLNPGPELENSQGQILPPRNVRGMSVIPPKAAVNADIFVRPVRAIRRHTQRSKIHALETLDALLCAHHHTHLNGYIEPAGDHIAGPDHQPRRRNSQGIGN